MPKRWFDKVPHTHVALDGALESGLRLPMLLVLIDLALRMSYAP